MKTKYSLKDVGKNLGSADTPIGVILIRPFSMRISWFLVNFTKLTPTQLSFLGLFVGIGGAVAFYYQMFILGAILSLARYLFDCFDGIVARVKGITSKYGAFLDNYAGLLSSALTIPGLCFGLYFYSGNIIWLYIAPFMAMILTYHIIESLIIARVLGDKAFTESVRTVGEASRKGLIAKLKYFLKKHQMSDPFGTGDLRLLLFVVGPLFGITYIVFWFCLIVFSLKEVFFFFYYSGLLKSADKLNKKNSADDSNNDRSNNSNNQNAAEEIDSKGEEN
jgi:phosphatidylglycerophosphate synthase